MSPEPSRLRLRLAPGRRVARALTLVLAASLAIGGAIQLGSAPLRADDTETDSHAPASPEADSDDDATDDGDAGTPQLLLGPVDPTLSPDDAELQVEVLIRNPREEPLPGGTGRFTLTLEPVGAAGSAESGANAEAPVRVAVAEIAVGETAGGSEQRLTATIPREDLPLDSVQSRPGVYELQLGLGGSAADRSLIATAPVVWRGYALPGRASLTVIVPMLLPGDVTTMPTPEELAGAASELDRLLTAAEAAQATLAIDPRLIAAIRGYGTAAPEAARNLLERLESSELPSFLLQFADADPAVQAALGFDRLLEPSGLGFVTRDGSFEGVATEALLGANGVGGMSSIADLPLAAPPTLEQLLAWDHGYAGAWPAEGQVDRATLDLLHRGGVSRVVLDSSNATTLGGTRFDVDGDIEALVADAGLGAAVRRALVAEDPVEQAAARAEVAALLALDAGESGGTAVLALDRDALATSAASAPELLDWLVALDWVSAVPETEQPEGSGSLLPGEVSQERVEQLRALAERSDEIVALAPLLQHPEYLHEYQSVRMLAAFATRYARSDLDFRNAVGVHREEDELLLRGVQVVSAANIQLVGTSSQLPVQLHNSLPFDAEVSMRVAPVSAALAVPDRLFEPQRVASGSNTTVLVPVRSRISSGESAVQVQIADLRGEHVYVTARLPLTLRTAYETILLSSLGVFAALLLGFGVWRSIRRRRLRALRAAVVAEARAQDSAE